jgi:ATP-dependent Clp protease ATP-binding subunit ClpC
MQGQGTSPVTGTPTFTPRSKQVLETMYQEALGFGHNYIGCEHMLLGLISVEDSLASQVMRRMGLELRTTRRAVVSALSGFVYAKQQKSGTAKPAAPAMPAATLEEILRRLDAIEQRLGD